MPTEFGQTTSVFAVLTQPIVAEGLARVLDPCHDLHFLGFAADPEAAGSRLADSRPGVVLIDQGFGLRTVFDLLAELRGSVPEAAAVVWAKDLSPSDRRLAVEAGARGVLDKTLPVDSLVECLRAVAAGRVWIEPDSPNPGDLPGRVAHRLTPREREVVALVQAGLKNREIAERMTITTGTVKVHLMHIFEKTGVRDRFELSLQAARLLEFAPPASQESAK